MKQGENIKRQILISVMLVLTIVLAMNFVCAADETVIVGQDNLSHAVDDLSEISISADLDENEISPEEDCSNLNARPSKTIEITQDNYANYFDSRSGKILGDADISSGDVVKIGNISNRAFVIDRQLTIMPITPHDEIHNGFIHLTRGSDGSTVTNLTINNTEGTLKVMGVTVGQLHGIWLSNTNNNLLSYNTIRIANAAGVYAIPMGWSSNNRIIYNDMKTYVTTNIIMGNCHYNLISHNSLEVLSYSDLSVTNLIYFNPFGHADYYGSPLCKGNIISYNYLKGFCTLPMSIILQMEYASHDGTVIANNTIIKGSYGINLNGNNVSVYNNTVINGATGICVTGGDFTVTNNSVMGDSQKAGIIVSGVENTHCEVFDNDVAFEDVSTAVSVGNYVDVHDNRINVKNYGVGISLTGVNSTVHENNIKNYHDSGISILGSFNEVDNNIINTKSIGINVPAASTGLRYYNNSLTNNRITSESYGISVEGLVYNSIIKNNIIESNSSTGINMQITDEMSNTQLDNVVNGVVFDSTAIVVNDDNFYKYFDNSGRLTYDFGEEKNKVVILTFLTNKNIFFDEKITVMSNKLNNLLFNVTITFDGDAEGSLIRDFNFMNFDKEAIIVNGVNGIGVSNNNITSIFKKGSLSNSAILIQDICDNLDIIHNNIYVNSKVDYVYAINAPSTNLFNNRLNNRLSTGANVADNTIIMISSGVSEGLYVDSLSESDFTNNRINIICDDYAYGLAFANLIGRLSGINVSDNEIVIHSKQMAYLIEFHMLDNSTISHNRLYSESNGTYGMGIYMSNNISVENNVLSVIAGDLKYIDSVSDVLGIGNAAIAIIKNMENVTVSNNEIYTTAKTPISSVNVTEGKDADIINNSFIVDDENYDVYFTKDGKLREAVIEENSNLILKNLTGHKTLEISIPLDISSYDWELPIDVALTLTKKASSSRVHDISFVNSTVNLKDSSNVILANNKFISSNPNILSINGGKSNRFFNNTVDINSEKASGISLIKTQNNEIDANIFNISGGNVKVISIDSSYYTLIQNNAMKADGDDVIFIDSKKSMYDNVTQNLMNGRASSIFGYSANSVNYGYVGLNDIEISGNASETNQAGVNFIGSSMRNNVVDNHIVSTSLNGDDYAVRIIANSNLYNSVINNFLISSNGSKRADNAVLAKFGYVHSNSPIDLYVSANGSDLTGDGSSKRPYASISKAVENALNHAVIYVEGGYYNESDIIVDKNITIFAANPREVIIDAGLKQLFNISKEGILSLNGVVIQNAHNQIGGSAVINDGKLTIINSVICNSSSYYDNSNPVFDRNIKYDEYGEVDSAYTYDCSDEGKGGAILNNGELLVDSSVFYNNLGHKGGAIADFGKTTVNSSVFYNNRAVHGGVIYTDSNGILSIDNSSFRDNVALTSIDFCQIKKSSAAWSLEEGNIYTYNSVCEDSVGMGGVIHTKNTSLSISDSNFIDNRAKSGGVISTYADSFSSRPTYESNVDLVIDNCYFINNKANDTRKSFGSNDLDNYRYYSGFNGGVVYGSYNNVLINDSEFYFNQASDNGGVLYVRANNGKIMDSKFEENKAGSSAGALDLSSNFIIMRSVISNNSARYGGAIEYNSYSYYGHIQNNLNIYNSTISNNRALISGGAFSIGSGNITVRDSNIVGNNAPEAATIRSSSSTHAIDMRYNYWGISSAGRSGPDDSVWKINNLDFRPWHGQWVKWEPKTVDDDSGSSIDVNPVDDQPSNPRPVVTPINPNPGSTGSSTSTGTSISGGGNGNGAEIGGYSGDGDGSNLGPGGSGTGGGYDVLPGNSGYAGQKIAGNANSSSNVFSPVDGTVDSNSMSQSNSSNYNANLASVGMTSNAASASSSSQGNGESAQASSSGDASKAYQIDEKIIELLNEDESMLTFVVIAILTLILLVVGYKRKEREIEED